MTNKIKWFLALVVVLGMVAVVQANAQNDIYLPLISSYPTPTPKPSECLNQVFFISGLKLCFTGIDYKPTTSELDEWVTIKNLGSNAVEMEGFRIASDSSTEFKYEFPKFTLNSGQTVKVWTKLGTNSSTTLFMNRTTQFWQDNKDCGYLKNDERKTINSFCYGLSGFTAAPLDK
ncbi:MAG: lamin tail domain-containing protein [Anaerolineales bacterium]